MAASKCCCPQKILLCSDWRPHKHELLVDSQPTSKQGRLESQNCMGLGLRGVLRSSRHAGETQAFPRNLSPLLTHKDYPYSVLAFKTYFCTLMIGLHHNNISFFLKIRLIWPSFHSLWNDSNLLLTARKLSSNQGPIQHMVWNLMRFHWCLTLMFSQGLLRSTTLRTWEKICSEQHKHLSHHWSSLPILLVWVGNKFHLCKAHLCELGWAIRDISCP